MAIAANWRIYRDRIDALNLRERVLVFLGVCVVLVAIVDNFLIQPTIARQKAISAKTDQQRAEVQTMRTQAEKMVAARAGDKSGERKKVLDELRREVQLIEARIAEKQRELVPPERMAALLQDLTRRNRSVQIEALRNIDPTPVGADSTGAGGMFRHGVELTVAGSYLDLLAYVSDIEKLPVKVFWGGIDLTMRSYPVVTMRLTLYTLSLDKTWLVI